MRLIVNDYWTYIEGKAGLGLIDSVTSYQIHGRWFAKTYRQGNWDGVKRFRTFDRKKGCYKIWSGFVPRITKVLDANDFRYELLDDRDFCPPDPVTKLVGKDLSVGRYNYQADAVAAACREGRGVIQCATGAGKTVMGAAIVASYDLPTVWLTHRRELLYQAKAALESTLGKPVGIIGDQERQLEQITVCMVQSLAKEKDKAILEHVKSCEVMVADEVHHLEAAQWQYCAELISAKHPFGLTATPNFAGAGLALLGVVGPVIYRVTTNELIRRGVLVPPRCYFLRPTMEKLDKKAKFPTVYSQGVVNNEARNNALCSAADTLRQEGKNCLTLVRQINHGKILADLFSFNGIKTEFIQGATSMDERKSVMERLKNGSLHNVVAMVSIMGEGVDFPWLQAIINATGSSGGGSAGSDVEHEVGRVTTQVLGRGMRCYEGKTHFDYIDVKDDHHKFLIEATRDRVATLEEAGHSERIMYWGDRE